jgi:hypothetical protein
MLIKVEKNGQPLHILESELEIYQEAGYVESEVQVEEEAAVEVVKTPAKKGKKATPVAAAVVVEPEESDYDDDLEL